MEKQDLASAYRRMKSPNLKTRKRALKIIKEVKRNKKQLNKW
ncbi:putative metal homeostasis protein [Enterococcus sp. CSURQ0835]|nr:putative metal homeostasis protein [Enterococcus sp. CSURQ0835]